ncbi:FXYD domain containing ion transport regulator 7 isoform X2 [Esox lucius]|uniref:FXYD domain containing ion transport regulator 7 isoform X2 n=1 Tax=Esox lucius TaxID=8010 RepID=UPI0005771017|nr:FXYD domain containing ion transport regulator 7 isoform X2 [Esox lucius]
MTTERESMFPDQSDFEYDYETLRTTGVIIGVILFVSGILIALSKKITKCSKSSSNSNPAGTQIPKTEGELPVPPQTV